MKKMITHIKHLACCLALIAFTASATQAQVNDPCAGAIALTCGATLSGTTANATPDNVAFCGTSNTGPGVWYSFIGTGQQVEFSLCNNTSYDSKISVFEGTCANLICVDGNDDDCGLQSRLTIQTNAATQYFILVHGFLQNTGSFDITATCLTPPMNDDCAGAIPVNCGSTTFGSTTTAGVDAAPSCTTLPGAPGVWYQVTGTGGVMIANTCGAGTNYDTRLSVYSGFTCTGLTCVDGNDDFCGLQSQVSWSSTAGFPYFILVHGFGTASGDFELFIDCAQVAPPNDDVCNATPVTFGVTNFANCLATAQTGEVSPGPGTGSSSCNSQDGWCSFELDVDASVWFTFQAPASGCVSIAADGADLQLALYAATNCNDFGTFVEIAANDDSGDQLIVEQSFGSAGIIEASCLMPGQTYYIQVDGFGTACTDSGSLHLFDCGGTLPNVDAGECQSRFVGYAPAEADTNCLIASATGGVAPYSWVWTAVGDQTIFFQEDTDSTSAIAVQPNVSTTYFVTITDSRGCSSTDSVEVNVIDVTCVDMNGDTGVVVCCTPQSSGILNCDFDQDGMGNFLPQGRVIEEQYANRGIHVSADNNGGGPDDAVIFNSSSPTGGDFDLGTPNQQYGGPGIGSGGASNNVPLGNILIVQERFSPKNCGPQNDDYCVPDDEAGGGKLIFEFDCPTTIIDVVIVDADDGYPSGSAITCVGTSQTTMNIANMGNNSVQTVLVGISGVTKMEVEFFGSGGLASFRYKPDTTELCLNPNTVDIDSLIARPEYSLGPCGNPCTATNVCPPAPPACVDLIVNVTTDNFASETSWTVTNTTTGQPVGDRQFTFLDDAQTFADTFCVDPRDCYDITIFDSFGDGICCGTFGDGDWNVVFDGTLFTHPDSGSFGSQATIQVGNCIPDKGEAEAEAIPEPVAGDMMIVAYPNPTSDQATVKFRSPVAGFVTVDVFSITGLKVKTLFSGQVQGGEVRYAEFDASNVPAGIYIYKIVGDMGTKAGKLQIAK